MNRLRQHRLLRSLCCVLSLLMIFSGSPVAWSQVVPPMTVLQGEEEKLVSLSFRDAPVAVVLDHYAEITGRTMIQSPGVPQVLISLRGQQRLTETEFLVAIESVLAMNNITLIPMGDKFLKVVPSGELGTHGGEIRRDPVYGDPLLDGGTDTMDTRIFELQHIDYTEIQPILEGMKRVFGKIQPLERTNSLLIMDTAANLQKIADIISYLDVPLERKVETRIYELNHAEAAQVAARLNELVQESQQDPQRRGAAPAVVRTVRGVIRPGQLTPPQPPGAGPEAEAVEAVSQGIILPPVKIVSDERTNILIVISRPENFAFFDNIVTILDRSIEPNFLLEVIPLEFADAGEIAGILNDFVGAATADLQGRGTRAAAGTPAAPDAAARSTALQDLVRQRMAAQDAAARATARAAGQTDTLSDEIGRLSANTRILSDQRTNSILLMGRRQDIEALRVWVESLDIMLAQVLIEAVILEVNLNEGLEYGIDWLQRSFTVSNVERVGPGGGLTVRDPVFAFGGAQNLRGGPFVDGSQVSRENAPDLFSSGSLSYFLTFFDLNLDAVVRLAAGSSDARILSTPVIVTTDNTEARILVGESRPVVTSTSTTAGGVARNTFQYQEIGISLNVTPRINPQNFVVMEITQTADNVGGFEVIDGNNVPIITRRELQAQIAVEDRGTIVLGGLVSSDGQDSTVKVPILGDIPILGTLFRSERKQKNRTELLVLITPYVLTTPQDVAMEARRLRDRSFIDSSTWEGSWTDSKLLRRPDAGQEEAAARPPLMEVALAEPVEPPGIFGRKGFMDKEIASAPPMQEPEVEPGEPAPVPAVELPPIELEMTPVPPSPATEPLPPIRVPMPVPEEEVWRPAPVTPPLAPVLPIEPPEPAPVLPFDPPEPVPVEPFAPIPPVPVIPRWEPDQSEEEAVPPLTGLEDDSAFDVSIVEDEEQDGAMAGEAVAAGDDDPAPKRGFFSRLLRRHRPESASVSPVSTVPTVALAAPESDLPPASATSGSLSDVEQNSFHVASLSAPISDLGIGYLEGAGIPTGPDEFIQLAMGRAGGRRDSSAWPPEDAWQRVPAEAVQEGPRSVSAAEEVVTPEAVATPASQIPRAAPDLPPSDVTLPVRRSRRAAPVPVPARELPPPAGLPAPMTPELPASVDVAPPPEPVPAPTQAEPAPGRPSPSVERATATSAPPSVTPDLPAEVPQVIRRPARSVRAVSPPESEPVESPAEPSAPPPARRGLQEELRAVLSETEAEAFTERVPAEPSADAPETASPTVERAIEALPAPPSPVRFLPSSRTAGEDDLEAPPPLR